jgi:tetratricopeptide (TPR) repeat protein
MANDTRSSVDETRHGKPLLAVLAGCLVIRLLHLSYAIDSPLTYQLGPDEQYYLAMARDVAFGQGGMHAGFAFMDPLYGYLMGALLWLGGGSTAYLVYRLAAELGYRREGLAAAAIYALTASAVMYSATLLKATWVAAFAALWMLVALKAIHSARARLWLAFGALCGISVALRANLLLLAGIGLVIAPALVWRSADRPNAEDAARPPKAASDGSNVRSRPFRLAMWAWLGFALALAPFAVRNFVVSGDFSPLPNNGGVVLHQLYNPDNPRALNAVPDFVSHAHPAEIWRGYTSEAERRLARSLGADQVDVYWRQQATSHIKDQPGRFIGNILRKAMEFTANAEVPNNRSLSDERRYSPVLQKLPTSFGILLALGLPGLIALTLRRADGLVLLAPIAVSFVTFVIFFAESRFRIAALPALALGAALFAGHIFRWVSDGRYRVAILSSAVAATLVVLSFGANSTLPAPEFNWQRAAWGYINSGRLESARELIAHAAATQPISPARLDLEGYLALVESRFPAARDAFQASLTARPGRHEIYHNLSLSLEGMGLLPEAVAAERNALALADLPEYRLRLEQLTASISGDMRRRGDEEDRR